jgi:hypothetical protein
MRFHKTMTFIIIDGLLKEKIEVSVGKNIGEYLQESSGVSEEGIPRLLISTFRVRVSPANRHPGVVAN